jgi:hypothetical protein
MGNYKEHPKYNVISIRITDGEKAFFEDMKRKTRKNISMLMREAMQHYSHLCEAATSHGQ